jgi:hypothetical protein
VALPDDLGLATSLVVEQANHAHAIAVRLQRAPQLGRSQSVASVQGGDHIFAWMIWRHENAVFTSRCA